MSIKATPLYEVFPGSVHPGPVYRVVRRCPPTRRDFLSYEALGQRYDRRDFFKGTGVSMRASRSRARTAARRFSLGQAIATVDLAADGIVYAPTGPRGHITVWAPPELLLECVVQCERNDD